MVRIFELLLFGLSLAFWQYSKISILPPSQDIPSCLLTGLFVGIFLSVFSFYVAKRFKSKAIDRYVLEFHREYLKGGWFNKYIYSPLLISVPEELFFRGLLLPYLGFLFTNTLFSLIHIIRFSDKIVTFVSIFIYGTFFSLTLYLTHSLLASLVAHYTFTILRIYYFPMYIENNQKLFSRIRS